MQLLHTSLGNGLTLAYQEEDEIIGGQIATSGEYEPFEEELLLSSLKTGDIALDIGANIGIYTLQMAQKVGDEGHVYAFEPESTNVEILRKNTLDNGFKNVTIYPFALSDRNGETRLYKSWDNFGDHRIYDGNYNRKRVSIPVKEERLDDALGNESKPVSVIKIDTQGYEPFVIKGAENIIRKNTPNIFLEYWPFAYKKAHADEKEMLEFLFAIYPYAFIIDGKAKKLFSFSEKLITDEKDEWANLLFTKDQSFE